MEGGWAIGVALFVALVGPVATYIIAARRLSGRIQTTEASELWAESRSIREHLQSRLDAANKREEAARGRIQVLEERVDELEELLRVERSRADQLERRLASGDL